MSKNPLLSPNVNMGFFDRLKMQSMNHALHFTIKSPLLQPDLHHDRVMVGVFKAEVNTV